MEGGREGSVWREGGRGVYGGREGSVRGQFFVFQLICKIESHLLNQK